MRAIMPRSKSSNEWLRRHVNDPYVKKAQLEGYRSRSAYKLIELNEKDRLIKPNMFLLDLGSAPGGWSQVASKLIGRNGRVLATDILPMEPIKNVEFVQGDFTDDAVVARLMEKLGGEKFDALAYSRQQADYFCRAGDRFIPESRHQEFRRVTFLMFHLAFGAVRLAIWEKKEGTCALADFKKIIQGHLQLLATAD